jgi:hypothetical protein
LQTFVGVEEMVNHYEKNELVLFSSGEKSGQSVLSSTPIKMPTRKHYKHVEIYAVS